MSLTHAPLRPSAPIARVFFLAVLLPAAAVTAQDDKSGYWLLNPTPAHLMRPLAADRPDATESPFTVDAGHIQIETSFIDYTLDDERDARTESLALFDTNVKFGVLNNVDLQLVFAPYAEERTFGPGPDSAERGSTDLQLRAKVNLWGNDSPGPANSTFALMPYIVIPTGGSLTSDKVEGGLIATVAFDVAETWGLGFQVEAAAVYDGDDDSYDTEFSHTAVVGFDLLGPFGAYIEYLGVLSTDADADYLPFFSTGVTWSLTDNLMLDVGTRIGLADEADDLNLFAGMTVRF